MFRPDRQPRLNFQAKVLIPVVTVMVLLLAITMGLVSRRFTAQLRRAAQQDLETANAVFQHSQQIHTTNLLARYRAVAAEPRVKSYSQSGNAGKLHDLLVGLVEDLGADAILFTGDKTESRADAARDARFDLPALRSSSALSIQAALDERPNVDTVRVRRQLFEVVSVPVIVSGYVVGVLTFGDEIHEKTAREFKPLTHSEIVFVADNRVAVSTLANTNTFPALVEAYHRAHGNGAQLSSLLLAGVSFQGLAGRFPSLKNDESLGYLLLSSNEPALRELRATQKMLAAVSLTAIFLGVVTVWGFVRKITRPLRQLRDGAEAVGRGDFSQRVAVTSHDECGDLAASFNQMTGNLKTSREELEKTVERLKTTQAQLVQSEKISAIGEFVAGVAHELNNPLTSVIGFAQLLQQSDTNPEHQRFLGRIYSEAQRCGKIVKSLLSFARQHAPERKRINLNESLNAALEILRYQLRTSGIEVVTQFDAKLPAVMADSHQLQQVFVNIINNARQAIEGHRPDGMLRLSTESGGGRVRVIFQDNGPGISDENLNKIFDPFFTTKEVGKGTGLGLSLSYGIIKEHGGNISASSNSGDGATFVIDLPIASNDPATGSESAEPRSTADTIDGEGKKVLVVDDEDSILELAREILAGVHFQVETASDGKSALRKLRHNRYDLILCDLKMPDLNGKQVYELIRGSNPEAASRFVFMTGDVVSESSREFFERHGKTCLAKPFSLEDFRATFRKLLQSQETLLADDTHQ